MLTKHVHTELGLFSSDHRRGEEREVLLWNRPAARIVVVVE